MDTSSLLAKAHIAESMAQQLKVGDAASVRVPGMDAPVAVQNLLGDGPTKPDAVLDASFEPPELNGRQLARADVFR